MSLAERSELVSINLRYGFYTEYLESSFTCFTLSHLYFPSMRSDYFGLHIILDYFESQTESPHHQSNSPSSIQTMLPRIPNILDNHFDETGEMYLCRECSSEHHEDDILVHLLSVHDYTHIELLLDEPH
jgi:hypothetical protein